LDAYIRDPRTEVRFIAEVDSKVAAERAAAVAKKQGRKPKVVRDMREALDSKDVDILSTATPNHWHALAGVWAMQAGKDCYLEKPISHEISEGRALVAAMEKYQFDRNGRGASADELTGLIYRNHNASDDSSERACFMIESLGGGVMIGHGADFAEQTNGMLKIEAPEFCAVVLASGWNPYPADRLGRLGYGSCRNVITNMDMEAMVKEAWDRACSKRTPSRAKRSTFGEVSRSHP